MQLTTKCLFSYGAVHARMKTVLGGRDCQRPLQDLLVAARDDSSFCCTTTATSRVYQSSPSAIPTTWQGSSMFAVGQVAYPHTTQPVDDHVFYARGIEGSSYKKNEISMESCSSSSFWSAARMWGKNLILQYTTKAPILPVQSFVHQCFHAKIKWRRCSNIRMMEHPLPHQEVHGAAIFGEKLK